MANLIIESFCSYQTYINLQAVFYVSGALGVAWFVLWMVFASNDPMHNRFISGGESKRILMERKEFSESKTSLFPPMHKIAAIPTVWITAISDFGQVLALTH